MKQQTEIHCPICGNHSEKVMPLPNWGEMRKCTDCGLFFADPMALPASAEEIYSKAYDGKGKGEAGDFNNFANKLRYRKALLRVRRYLLPPTSLKTLKWLQRNLPRGATVLEIGCGPGYFMHTLRRNGFKAIGIEPGEKPASILKDEGFRIWHGTLDNYPTDWPVPEAVISFGMLHHLTDPLGFFKTLRHRFPQAPLILYESHTNTLLFATRRDLPGSLPPRYFTWWTGPSLGRALRHAGFDATVSELPYSLRGFAFSVTTTVLGEMARLPSHLGWLLRGKRDLDKEWASLAPDYPTSFRQRFQRFTGVTLNLWVVGMPSRSEYSAKVSEGTDYSKGG